MGVVGGGGGRARGPSVPGAQDDAARGDASPRILGIDPGSRVVGWAVIEVPAPRAPQPVRRHGPRPRSESDTVVRDGTAANGAAPADRAAARVPLARRVANLQVVAGGRSQGARYVAADAIRLAGGDVAARLAHLAAAIEELVVSYRPHELALEEAFYGKSIQSALRIGEARGVILAAAQRAGLAIHQYTPARIKRCVTGHGAAGKEQVATLVGQALGLRAAASAGLAADATDALAVAWTRFEDWRTPEALAAARRRRG